MGLYTGDLIDVTQEGCNYEGNPLKLWIISVIWISNYIFYNGIYIHLFFYYAFCYFSSIIIFFSLLLSYFLPLIIFKGLNLPL